MKHHEWIRAVSRIYMRGRKMTIKGAGSEYRSRFIGHIIQGARRYT